MNEGHFYYIEDQYFIDFPDQNLMEVYVMQDSDFNWFKEHLSELYKQYGDSYLAIKNQTVIGVYASFADVVKTTAQTEELGTFIVQQCGKDESSFTVHIASMNFMD